jgi:pimeloyl-ACP methyl ester carboxylesterase
MGYRRLALDAGSIEYIVGGPEDAAGLVMLHVGSPAAAVEYPGLTRAAAAAGMRVASYSRGGYGGSARREGRSVADEVAICTALADHLGHERFFPVGWSGGGPVALACAALVPERVPACVSLASIAPWAEAGDVWESFVSPAALAEWRQLAAGDVEALAGDFEEAVVQFGRMTPRRLQAVGGSPDARAVANALDTEIRPSLVRSMRRAVMQGAFGYLDDNLAQARSWGFRVADIRVPVVIRHGELDRLVDVGHGRWLGEAIRGAQLVILPDAGHGSVALPWEEVVAQLVAAAD